MFTRKSVFVALMVIAMLAMIVPAAMAAPETVKGVAITAPTEAKPFLVSPPTTITIKYTVTVDGQQPGPTNVWFWLIDDYGNKVLSDWAVIPGGDLVNGSNDLTREMNLPDWLQEGWYNLKICVDDGVDPYCTTQPHSVRVDMTAPKVQIERPSCAVMGCTWVTGNQYELFGMATDNVEVAAAWFEYTVLKEPASPIKIGNENANLEGQNATPVAGFPGEYNAVWNSSLVPDGLGFIRFCADDTAGNGPTCTNWVDVCIENRVKVQLAKGWNLVSTPIMLYNNSVSDVLKHVWNPMNDTQYPADNQPIDMIYTTRNAVDWSWWKTSGPDGVSAIEDGYGYWVHTVAPATIEFVGTWESVGPVTPPEYAVQAGWNLIGYTHWGTPTDNMFYTRKVSEYLGFPMMVSVESMYRYDALAGHYVMVDEVKGEQNMMQGAGYWLGLAEGTEGTINP